MNNGKGFAVSKIPVRHLKYSFFEERFSIRQIQPLVTESDLHHHLHRHDFYFLLFVKAGKGDHQIDFCNYKVRNHSVFFIRPGQVHQLHLAKGTCGFMLQFTPDFYSPIENATLQVLRKVSARSYCQLAGNNAAPVFSLLDSILDEFSRKCFRYKDAVRSYLDILFIHLARQSENPSITRNEGKAYAQERLEELLRLLEQNIFIKKQVADYATMLSMTSYQLNAITKSLLQKTVSELINAQIVLEAKRLLTATHNQVNQVADILGYEDSSYFIRFFKKQTGLTPEAFRQNFK